MILQICLVRRYVLVMSLTHFRVNPHSIVAWTSRTPCSKLKWNLKCLSVRLQTMWFSCSHLNFRFPAWFEQEFLDVQATIECGFTLKCVREMTRTYIQMHRTDKYSQILRRPVWINGWVFVYELSGCGFQSRYSNLIFRYRTCFEEGVPWHSGKYRLWIHSETRTWHDKNIQSD